ncbi:MAG: hypothetical protein QW738_07970 [Nitrososphaeria archaeon]
MNNEKIKQIISSYAKKFSKEEIYTGQELKQTKEEIVSTGILTVDLALGIGGIPMGKIIEVYGQESSGKTTFSLITISQMQKANKICAFIDAENSFDPIWAETLGVNLDELLLIEANSLEESLEKLEFLINQGVQYVVYDSIVAPPTVSQNKADYGDSLVGVRARVLSMALSKLMPVLRQNKATIMFINQIREKIGVYGNPETTPGGRALKFFSSLRLNMRKKPIKDEDGEIGDEVHVKVEKNKFAPPMKRAKFLLFYDGTYTIDYPEILSQLGLVKKSGAWYKEQITGEEKTFHGAIQLIEEIKNNKPFAELVDQKIREKITNLKSVSLSQEEEEGEDE